ncbi:MAG: sigma-54-dependent Fis family transcriptional regulator [Spirochaeta sp.]|nr:sigma-54-dependent Fis family transcriptional regulator [Spirochaeta sp.]
MESREVSFFLNTTTEGIIAIDRSAVVTLFNRAAEHILSIDSAYAIGRRIEEVLPVTRLPAVLESGEPELDRQMTWRAVTIVTSRYPIRDDSGTVFGAAAVFRDITELQRLAEEITNLREVRLLNHAIFQSTWDAISVVDENGLGVMVNPSYSRVTGLKEEDVLGKPCTVDIASGKSIHMEVLRRGVPVHNARLRVGPYRRDVIVDANPIIVDGAIRGSVAVIKDVSELMQLNDQLENARETIRKLEARYTFDDVIGEAPSFLSAVERAKVAAATPATVLLRGESGTGKELFAHAIHNASERRNARFIRVNCAALSENVLESELFGYVEGAFTGARKGGRRGLFEEAHAGTILLDEVGLMSLDTQAKLLRVVQEHEIRRVGGTDAIPINVRVIAATNLDLFRAVHDGRFREDLYYRLHVVPVEIPPLRDRREDIPLLAEKLLVRINSEYGRVVTDVAPGVMEELGGYRWPGNVRELENVLRRAVISMNFDETVLERRHLPTLETVADGCVEQQSTPSAEEPPAGVSLEGANREVANGPGSSGDAATPARSLDEVVAAAEDAHIRDTLRGSNGNRTQCATRLGISLRALQYKLRRYGIR